MVWQWSHSPEAYDNLMDNISKLSLEDVKIILAEIATCKYAIELEMLRCKHLGENYEYSGDSNDYFTEDFYQEYLTSDLSETILDTDHWVDIIYSFACDLRECTNGGHEAYICPYGCHTVSFSTQENTEEQ